MSKPFKTDLREARKHKPIRETTFAEHGNAKPFGKRLSPHAEISNHSGNDFRQARKLQTIREITFAMRGNNKPARDINKKKRPFDCSNERSNKKEAATHSPALPYLTRCTIG